MASTNVGNAYVTVSARFDKSWSSGVLAKANAVGDLISKGISAGISAVSNSVDAAIKRVDTMNSFPRIMENMGIGADAAKASIDRLSAGIDGLPTALDTAVLGVERFTSKNSDVEKSTEYFLALNDAILAGGASTEIQNSAIEQLSQSYAKGKMDMQEWRSLQMAMPAQLNQVAKAMGKTTDELGEGLRKGEISMDEFMDTLVRLDKDGGDSFASFAEQAQTATGGISTALTNVQNRVNKAVANIIDAIGAENISKAINAFSSSFGAIAQPVVDFIDAFKGSFNPTALLATLGPLADTFGGLAKAIGGAAAQAGEFFGNLATVAMPVLSVVVDQLGKFVTMVSNFAGMYFDGLNSMFDGIDLMAVGWQKQMDSIDASSAQLDHYVGIIEELAGQEELTRVQQIQLQQAVEGYNKITGDSVEIVDAQRGALSKSTEEIRANSEAWKDNAYMQAYQQQVADIVADNVAKQRELADATDKLAIAEQNLNAYRDDTRSDEAYLAEMDRLDTAYQQAQQEVDRLTDDIEANNRKLEEGEERMSAMDASLLAYVDSNSELQRKLNAAGVSSTKFSNYLATLGKTEDDLANMAPGVIDSIVKITASGEDMSEDFGRFLLGMSDGTKKAADTMQSTFDKALGGLASKFGSTANSAKKSSNEMASSASNAANKSASVFSGMADRVKTEFANAKSGAKGNLDQIPADAGAAASGAKSKFQNLGSRITDAIGSIKFPTPHVSYKDITIMGKSVSLPKVEWYARGGFVDGATLIGAGERGAEAILPRSGGLMDDFSENLTKHVDNEDVIEWLAENLGPTIGRWAPEATPREFGRMVRAYA